jgi:hypothetical protein
MIVAKSALEAHADGKSRLVGQYEQTTRVSHALVLLRRDGAGSEQIYIHEPFTIARSKVVSPNRLIEILENIGLLCRLRQPKLAFSSVDKADQAWYRLR